MASEGVDYSRTGSANWTALAAALKANGKKFAGRYAVNDKSPTGRGITADEYQALRAAGIDVFLYWQTTTNWMLNGYTAGVSGAVNAQQNINAAGMPHDMPVYFACDFDAEPHHQSIIDDCLRGAASVLGAERVGLYAGYYPLMRAMQNGSARWLCQTTAWSGGLRLPQAHLYQYEYNQWYGGTNCDDVRAYAENFGQASMVGQATVPDPDYADPTPPYPPGTLGWEQINGIPVYALVAEVEVVAKGGLQPLATVNGKPSGPKLPQGATVKVIGSFATDYKDKNGKPKKKRWIVLPDGSRAEGSRCRPLLPYQP